jgi:hypothetical protein
MSPEELEWWLRVVARALITAVCVGAGIWLVIGQQVEWGYSFIAFVAGYWLK